jgi:DNA-binding MarR family transcriptional regulator
VSVDVNRALEEILRRLERLEDRVNRIEMNVRPYPEKSEHNLTPALVRTLATVRELGGSGTPEDVASRLGIPRNIASLYLNRLSKMGYLGKNINPNPTIRARYIYRLNEENIDSNLEELLKQFRSTFQKGPEPK